MIATHGLSKRFIWELVTRRGASGARLAGLFADEEGALFDKLGLKIPRVVIPNGFRKPDDRIFSEPALIPGNYILFLGFFWTLVSNRPC